MKKIILLLMLVVQISFAASFLTIPYTFQPRQLISAAKIMANYNALRNGLIDGTNKVNIAELWINGTKVIETDLDIIVKDITFTGDINGDGTDMEFDWVGITADRVTFLGDNALSNNVVDDDITGIGYNALLAGGRQATAVGSYAGESTYAGDFCTYVGYRAGNAPGTTYGIANEYNTAVGWQALDALDGWESFAGARNTAIGAASLGGTTTGIRNSAVGMWSAFKNTSGSNNEAYGFGALYNNVSGNSNIAIGTSAMNGSSGYSQYNNVVIGEEAGHDVRNASNNIFIGYKAADKLTTGNNNIIIGYDIDTSTITKSYELNIGDTLYGDLSNNYIGIGVATPLTSLDIGGGIRVNRTATAVSYQTLATDYYIGVTNTDAERRITLDTDAVIDGRTFIIKDESGGAGTNSIIIATEGSETIDGSSTATISTNYSSYSVISDGTNWFIY